jgi:hypothetical protein
LLSRPEINNVTIAALIKARKVIPNMPRDGSKNQEVILT